MRSAAFCRAAEALRWSSRYMSATPSSMYAGAKMGYRLTAQEKYVNADQRERRRGTGILATASECVSDGDNERHAYVTVSE